VISLREFRELSGKKTRKNKYNAKKTRVGDIVLDSAGEADRYGQLLLLEKAGVISDLKRQVRLPLIVNGCHLSLEDKVGRRRPRYYVADFTYIESDGSLVIEDFKGFDTPTGKLKRAIIEATLGITVRITR
jgi:hypothetical protein